MSELTQEQRAGMASAIIETMRDDASDEELGAEYQKWVKHG